MQINDVCEWFDQPVVLRLEKPSSHEVSYRESQKTAGADDGILTTLVVLANVTGVANVY
jgi:hypothetical protein